MAYLKTPKALQTTQFCSCFRSNKEPFEMGFQIIVSSKRTQYPVMYFTQALGSVNALGDTQTGCSEGNFRVGRPGCGRMLPRDAAIPAQGVPGRRCRRTGWDVGCGNFHPAPTGQLLTLPARPALVCSQLPVPGGHRSPGPPATHHGSAGQRGPRRCSHTETHWNK